MKGKKENTRPQSGKPKNVFAQILEDKKRISEAISNGAPLSSLKGIKFVKPI